MPVYKVDEIRAYWVGEEVFCSECYEEQKGKFDSIVTDKSVEDSDYIYVCDGCNERIE